MNRSTRISCVLAVAVVLAVVFAPGPVAAIPKCPCNLSCACIVGTGGPDVINGPGFCNNICGQYGDDVIYGAGGDDVLLGGPGDDCLYGLGGDDVLDGGLGYDKIDGGPGTDTCSRGEVVTNCP